MCYVIVLYTVLMS